MVSAEVWSQTVRDQSCGPTDGRTKDRTAGPVLAFCGTMDWTSAGLDQGPVLRLDQGPVLRLDQGPVLRLDQGPVLRLVPDWTTETLGDLWDAVMRDQTHQSSKV
jgi:hypothetical protein